MSHTTYINGIIITDVAALRGAVNQLKSAGVNVELRENVKPRAYSTGQKGMDTVADYVLHLPNATYDVGLYRSKDGAGYECRTDFHNGSVARQLGNGNASDQERLGKLYQAYSEQVITNAAIMQGQNVTRHVQEDGTVQLRIA